MKHQLSLEVPDTYNCKILRVIDTSKYDEDMEVTCGYLQILGPGYINPVLIEVTPGFSLILSACTLGLQSEDCGISQYSIPDGIYNIEYSVAPNTEVLVEYNYLRTTNVLNDYYKQLGLLEIKGCPIEDCSKINLRDLRDIKSYLEVAKAKVEYYNELEEGIELLQYADKKLKSYSKNCCK